MARGIGSSVALLALAACNQIFDLRPTVIQDGSLPIDGPPPVDYVQIAVAEQPADSAIATFPQSVTAGNALIVAIYVEAGDTPMVHDDLASSFQQALPGAPYAPLSGGKLYAFTAVGTAAGNDKIYVTAANASDVLVYAHEFTNVVAFDTASSGQGPDSGTNVMRSGPLQPSGPNELVFGFGISLAVAAGSGFTSLSSADGNCTEWRVVNDGMSVEAIASDISFDGTGWTMIGVAMRGK
jgi:hypothetical protein